MLHALPVLGYVVGLWWLATGVILFLNHLPATSFRISMACGTLLMLLALAGIHVASGRPTIHAAYLGFTCGLVAWGWQEMSFFMGVITGPHLAADPQARGWRRLVQATRACSHHEIACLAVAVAIMACSVGAGHPVGLMTYLALWLMRLSAKFNVFLGVRNLNLQWLPQRLSYLAGFMRRRAMNPLWPVSMLAGLAATWWVASLGAQAPAQSAVRTGDWLVACLLALGVIEHLFLVLPVPFASLWHGFAARCPAAPARDFPARLTSSGSHTHVSRRALRPAVAERR